MARRDMLSHTVWLRRIHGDLADGREVKVPPGYGLDGADMLRALNRLGYMVELWMDEDAFRLRAYPLPSRPVHGGPPVALSYSGASLSAVLGAALLDADILATGGLVYDLSTREHVRWAA